jgi:hypothetical protein
MRVKPTAEIWVPLAQVRLGERRARSLSAATVERYRQWLEQGREARPYDSFATATSSWCETAATASPPVTWTSRRWCAG